LVAGKPPVITQIDERDPTGVSLAGLNYANQNKSNFGFINRETIAETGWIDLNSRFYMPELMRFGQTDPIIEGQENYSLYQYSWNNPVLNSDPNGLCPSCPQGEEAAKLYAAGANVTNKEGSWTWTGSKWQDNNASPHSTPAGTQVMQEVSGFLGNFEQIWSGNRRFGDGREVNSKGILTDTYKPITGEPPAIGLSKIANIANIISFESKSLRISQTLETNSEMKALANLKKLIEKNGFNSNLSFDNQIQVFQNNGINFLVNGHHRLAVAQKLGISKLEGVLIDAEYLMARYGITPDQLTKLSNKANEIGNKIRWY
jgi:RHS repeat-associated protein